MYSLSVIASGDETHRRTDSKFVRFVKVTYIKYVRKSYVFCGANSHFRRTRDS
jgi:hypothetical protein